MAKGKYQEWLTEDGLTLLRHWKRHGLSNETIASDKIGISASTLYEWIKRYPEISEALKKGKDIRIGHAEDAIEKAFDGYYVWEEEWRRDPDTGEMVPYRQYKKWIKQDITALIFFLKNMGKDFWRDRQEVQMDIDEAETGVIALPDVMAPEKPPETKGDQETITL